MSQHDAGFGTSNDSTRDQVTGQVKDKVQDATGQAKGAANEQLDTRSTQLGETVESKADDVRAVSSTLHEQGNEGIAKLVDQAASYTEQMADYLKGADGGKIMGDLETFARKQPWAATIGGLALGFAASRVVRASSERRHDSDRSAAYDPSGSANAEYGDLHTPPVVPTGYDNPSSSGYEDLTAPSAGVPGTTPPIALPADDPLTSPLGGTRVDR